MVWYAQTMPLCCAYECGKIGVSNSSEKKRNAECEQDVNTKGVERVLLFYTRLLHQLCGSEEPKGHAAAEA